MSAFNKNRKAHLEKKSFLCSPSSLKVKKKTAAITQISVVID